MPCVRNMPRPKNAASVPDGDFDLLLRGVKDPARCVREEYAKQKADGSFKDIFAGKSLNVAPNGNASAFIRQPKFETDGWYGLRVKGRGAQASETSIFFLRRRHGFGIIDALNPSDAHGGFGGFRQSAWSGPQMARRGAIPREKYDG